MDRLRVTVLYNSYSGIIKCCCVLQDSYCGVVTCCCVVELVLWNN